MNTIKLKTSRIVITSIFLSLFILGTVLIFTTPSSVKITYGLVAETEDNERVAFNLFEPQNGNEEKKAVIIGHGVMCNKEMLKGYAIELAAAGFIAAPFDFRGHGQTSGELTRGQLIEDVKAVKKYLMDEKGVKEFGIIGYSMGGGPANEIVKIDEDFKCFIGIGTGLPSEENETVKADSGQFLNVLMILAKYDEAFDINRLKEQMGLRLGMSGDDIEVDKLYGSLEDGTASMIYYDDNSDHLTTAWDEDFIREARDWVSNTFPDVESADSNFYVNVRAMILLLQVIGGLGFFFLIIEPLSNYIVKPKEEDIKEIKFQDEKVSSISLKIILYSLILGIPGMLVLMPVIILLPLTIAGAMLMVLFGQTFGMIILLWRTAKKNDTSFTEYIKEPFKVSRGVILRNILLGVILSVLLYIILYLSFGLNYIGMAISAYRIIWVPFYYVIALFILFINSLMFQMVLQAKMGDGIKSILKSAGLTFAFQITYMSTMILVPCMIINDYFLAIALILTAPILLLSAFTSSVIYQKTGNNIIAGAITNALFIVCIIGTLSPFMNTLTMLMMFL